MLSSLPNDKLRSEEIGDRFVVHEQQNVRSVLYARLNTNASGRHAENCRSTPRSRILPAGDESIGVLRGDGQPRFYDGRENRDAFYGKPEIDGNTTIDGLAELAIKGCCGEECRVFECAIRFVRR